MQRTSLIARGRVAAAALFALLLAFIALPGIARADDAALSPGTYTITANLSMPGQYNPVLTGVTVYANNPNNPFGPTIDENDPATVVGQVPTDSLSMNAQLIVADDGTKTLYLPVLNPIFTLQELGSCASLGDVKVERVAPTHVATNSGTWEGNYREKESRIHKLTAVLSDTQTSGTKTYDFKGSALYAVPLSMELKPSGDIALQLTVDYDSAQKASDATVVPALETQKIVVNVPEEISLPYSGSGSVTAVYATSAMDVRDGSVDSRKMDFAVCTLKDTDKYVWSDGTTEAKNVDYSVGVADSLSVLPMIYNGEYRYYSTDRFKGVESFSGQWQAKDAGDYTVIATLKAGYAWDEEGTVGEKSQKWSITKKLIIPQITETIKEGESASLSSITWFGNEDPDAAFVAGESEELVKSYLSTPSVSLPDGVSRVEDLPAGTYSITWPGYFSDAGNYQISYLLGLWMHPSTLTVEEATKVAVPSGKEGLVYTGEAQKGIEESDAYTVSGEAEETLPGEYTATVTPNPGYKWNDGTRESKQVTWSISKATLTATYAGEELAYGDAPASPMTYSGWVGGENETTAANFVAPTVSLPESIEVGDEYALTPAGGSAKCYEFVYQPGVAKILPKGTAPEPVAKASAVYTGASQQGVSSSSGYVLSGNYEEKMPGGYKATATLVDGYVWSDGTREPKTLEWSIAKAPLTATYKGETATYGDAFGLEVSVEGFVGGETAETAAGYVAPTVFAPSAIEPNGEYTLTPEGGLADCYAFVSYASGVLKIEALGEVEIPVAASDLTYTGKEQAGIDAAANVILSGETSATNAGTYRVVASIPEGYVWADGSHSAKEIEWTIAKAKLTAAYVDESIDFGKTPAGKVDVTGFVNGETAETAAGYVAPAVSFPTLEAGKSYQVMPAFGEADNYWFGYQAGTLKVGAASSPTGQTPATSSDANQAAFAQTSDGAGAVVPVAVAIASGALCAMTLAIRSRIRKSN